MGKVKVKCKKELQAVADEVADQPSPG